MCRVPILRSQMYLSENRLNEVFSNLSGKAIAVIGDVMLDRYLWGNTDRISPEAPVPVVHLHHEETRIGGAANVADNLTVLGANPFLISVIGDDADGGRFMQRCKELELATDGIVIDANRSTTVKTRIISRHQQVCRVDREITEDIGNLIQKEILEQFFSIEKEIAAVIISDYGKGVITPQLVSEIVKKSRSNDIFVAVDPKEHHWEYYTGVNLIKPNHHEVARATNIKIASEQDLERAGWQLLKMTDAKTALITRGEQGMCLFEFEKPVKHLPTMAQEVYDVTGAGDTVIASVVAAIAGGASLEEAAIIANYAAGVVVTEVGTAAAAPEDIALAMERERKRTKRTA